MDYTKLVPVPADVSINTGRSPLHQKTVLEIFGAPRGDKPVDCSPITNPKLKAKIVTKSVGPFKVTGHKVAVDHLAYSLAQVKARNPELYALLGTAGMLCCRLVRGSKTSWSNHSFGFAVDVTIAGKLDAYGDDMVQAGLLELYTILKEFGWYWGAEYSKEDAMHFEPCDELVRYWHSKGLLA